MYVAEVIAPVMLIFGLWTRVAAPIIAFDMVMAIYLVRIGDIGKINPMGGAWAIEVEATVPRHGARARVCRRRAVRPDEELRRAWAGLA